jgi:hypothetical protein
MRRRSARAAVASAAGAMLLLCLHWGAWANEGISGVLVTDYSKSWGTTTDQSGRSEAAGNDALTEQLRFSVERRMWPQLLFQSTGQLEQDWASLTPGGSVFDGSSRAALLNTSLTLNAAVFRGALAWTHQTAQFDSLGSRSTSILDTESALLGWRPDGFPQWTLRFENRWQRDPTLASEDLHTYTTQAIASWALKNVSLSYSGTASKQVDNVAASSLWTLTNSIQASAQGRAFGDRTTLSAGLLANDLRSTVEALGAGSTRTTQVLAAGGLSLVEAFPATPALDQPVANPALIDGNTTASAGLNLGFAPALAGDLSLRDVGLAFPDAAQQVNLLWLWVDKRLPTVVWQSLAASFAVYQSDDSLHWTQVSLSGPVRFGAFDNRFELPIVSIGARYLKVVCAPLGAAVTTDKTYSDIFLTELQANLVEQLSGPGSWQGRTTATAQLSAHTALTAELSHDLSLQGRSPLGSGGPNTWVITNALSFSKKLLKPLLFGARASRQDSDAGSGHNDESQLAASLSFTPIGAMSQSATWGARWIEGPGTSLFSQSLSLFSRAQLYRGVGLQAGYGFTTSSDNTGRSTRGSNVTSGISLEPNKMVSLSGTYIHQDSRGTGGGKPDARGWGDNVGGSISLRPFAALYASGGISWVSGSDRSDTLVNLSAGFSPFRDGNLQVSCSYSETVAGGTRTRILNPGVRWNLASQLAQATVSYAITQTSTGVQDTTLSTLNANLQLRL